MRKLLVVTAAVGLLFALVLHERAEELELRAMAKQLERMADQLERRATVVSTPELRVIERTVRVEHDVSSPAATPTTRPTAPTAPQSTSSAPNEIVARAQSAIEPIVEAGRLSADDLSQLRAQIQSSSDPQTMRNEIRHQIAAALTQGRLRPDDPHHIFP